MANPGTILDYTTYEGAYYDVSALSSLYSDTGGTTAAVVDGPVGYMEDLSGNGHHLIASSDGQRPTLRQDGSAYYLEFDNVDDHMITASSSFLTLVDISVGNAWQRTNSGNYLGLGGIGWSDFPNNKRLYAIAGFNASSNRMTFRVGNSSGNSFVDYTDDLAYSRTITVCEADGDVFGYLSNVARVTASNTNTTATVGIELGEPSFFTLTPVNFGQRFYGRLCNSEGNI